MSDTQDYQKAISQYRSRISFIGLIFAGWLIVIGWWAKPLFFGQPPKTIPSGLELQRPEFEILSQGLETKTEPVILEPVVEADRGIGKAEPFQ